MDEMTYAAQPVTGVYAVAWWARGTIPVLGFVYVSRRVSEIYRVVFSSENDKASFPGALREYMERRGDELILCEELPARYK